MTEPCTICDGSGLRLVDRPDGTRAARECVCRAQRRSAKLIEQARIPQRYMHCTLDDFVPDYAGKNTSLKIALMQAGQFVNAYPLETDGRGILLTGPNGTGKTHLAVGMMRALLEKGAQCLFVTYGDLLKQVQNSYNPAVQETELKILQPIFNAEVLVLDELGSSKPSEWVWDTVAHILNTRYNEMRTTIITTNYPNERELLDGEVIGDSENAKKTWLALYKTRLGDRIGERMRSRLQEMCRIVEVTGPDFRQRVKRRVVVHKPEDTSPLVSQDEPRVISEESNPPQKAKADEVVVGRARMGSYASRHQPQQEEN